MTYHYLTIDELAVIVNLRDQGVKAYQAAKLLHRSLGTVYRVYHFLAADLNTIVKTGLIVVGRLLNCPLMR